MKKIAARTRRKPVSKPARRTATKRSAARTMDRQAAGRVPKHVHPYGTDRHRDLEWQLDAFAKLSKKVSESDRPMLDRALRLSEERHEGQVRLGGSPYVIHPVRIANILMGEWGVTDGSVVAAALLHDVVEDTATTIKEVKDAFGDRIGKLVDGMTMWKGSETYELYCKRVSRGPEMLRLIKCADALDNLRSWHETDATADGLTVWWRQTNDYILPMADVTDPQAARCIRSLLQDRWFLRMAQME